MSPDAIEEWFTPEGLARAGADHKAHAPGTLYFLYHELTRAKDAYGYSLPQDEFARHLELFASLRNSAGARLRPKVTFDDGHGSNHELALPVLTRFGVSAHFFLTAGWIATRSGYMDWAQVRSLAEQGHRIGAHGWSHKLLTRCSGAELQTELGAARRLLEDKLGAAVTTMSLPGGRSNGRVLEACAHAGYTQVFTSMPRAETDDGGALMGRLNLRGDVTIAWLEQILRPESGRLRRVERQHRIKATAQRALGDQAYARLWALLNRARPGLEGG